jgi:hypothetical protein
MRGLWAGGLLWVLGTTGAIALPQPVRSPLQLAQASADSPQKQEADQRFQRGIQQYQTSQFREALQSWESALKLYRNLQDRKG